MLLRGAGQRTMKKTMWGLSPRFGSVPVPRPRPASSSSRSIVLVPTQPMPRACAFFREQSTRCRPSQQNKQEQRQTARSSAAVLGKLTRRATEGAPRATNVVRVPDAMS